ncbi:MAG: HPF/RaiA family ribosome-associated protein [Bryobacterales bacterium]|nr:HPF/RaiA family ribosome-associated protein [Bryobacterales bacterium]
MTIQINSDKTIRVTAAFSRFVKSEVARILARFADRLTRVEIHLADVDNLKTGQSDKRCLVEVRPAGEPPITTSATSGTLEAAVASALGKMKRSLTTAFGRRGRVAASQDKAAKAPKKTTRKKQDETKLTSAKISDPGVKKRVPVKAAATEEGAVTKTSGRRPKKRIYQARRKPWPAR